MGPDVSTRLMLLLASVHQSGLHLTTFTVYGVPSNDAGVRLQFVTLACTVDVNVYLPSVVGFQVHPVTVVPVGTLVSYEVGETYGVPLA